LRSALSLKAREGTLLVVTGFPLEAPSTKKLRAQLDALGVEQSVLLVELQPSRELRLSARNLERVELRSVSDLTTEAVLNARQVLLSEAAVSRLEEKLTP
jgi:large subunit ribosomal protein L4